MSRNIENLRKLSLRSALYGRYVQRAETNHANLAGQISQSSDLGEILPIAEEMVRTKSRIERAKKKAGEVSSRYSKGQLEIERSLARLQDLSNTDPSLKPVFYSQLTEYAGFVQGQNEAILGGLESFAKPAAASTSETKDTQTMLPSQPAERKPKKPAAQEDSQSRKDKITLRFRDGNEIEVKNTKGAITLRKLLHRNKTVSQLTTEILGEDNPENRKNLTSHVIIDAKRIALENQYVITSLRRGGQTYYSLRKQAKEKVRSAKVEKPEVKLVPESVTQPETKPKRGYVKEADVEYAHKTNYVLPTGKELTVTQLQYKYLTIIEEGITPIDIFAKNLYPKTWENNKQKARQRVSSGVKYLNKILKDEKIAIYNLESRRTHQSVFSMQFEGNPEDAIQQTLLEESTQSKDLTNYEAAVLAQMATDPQTEETFKAKGIPVLDEKTKEEISKSGRDRVAPTEQEMENIRRNIIGKMQRIIDNNTFNESFDRSEACARLMLTYFVELGDKREEVFNILIEKLKKDTDIVVTTQRGRVVDIDIARVDKPLPPPTDVPTKKRFVSTQGRESIKQAALRRWEQVREEKERTTTVTQVDKGSAGSTIVETVETLTEEIVTGSVLVYDISTEDKPKEVVAQIESAEPKAKTRSQQFAERYPNIYRRDLKILGKMETIIEAVVREIPEFQTDYDRSIVAGTMAHAFPNLNEVFVDRFLATRAMKLQARNGNKVLFGVAEIAVLKYARENDPRFNFDRRAREELLSIAKELAEAKRKQLHGEQKRR